MTEPLRHEARMPLSSDTLSTALANLLPIQRYAMRRGYSDDGDGRNIHVYNKI